MTRSLVWQRVAATRLGRPSSVRIVYACYWNAGRRDGVATKIAAQVSAWRAAGHEATVHFLTPRPRDRVLSLEGEAFPFDGPAGRIAATRRLYGAVAAARPDLVYLRYDLFVPPPAQIARTALCIVEINSNLQAELAARSRIAAAYERAQRPALLRRAAGAVCVSRELGRAVEAQAPALPVRVIANGVDLAALPVQQHARQDGIRMVYMGEAAFWQGVDKVLELAAAFPGWTFDLVGVPADRSAENVRAHGFLAPEEYEPILRRADVAIGTLALHRKLMDETSALKLGLYLAYGLPCVIGYDDTNFSDVDPWYLLRLPNREANIRDNLDRIEAFVRSVKGRRVERSEVADRISIQAKEADRLAFFDLLTQGSHAPA